MASTTAGMSRRQTWITLAMAVLILIPSMYGFVGKFVEFVHNYLLASAGFFCMLLWAAWNGMFRDVERPKVEFLENESRLDHAVHSDHAGPERRHA